jgi:type IV pilus biogenesis protein CpaD/CtpE
MGGVNRYEVMQLRKMVKEDSFKRVKFITTTATEKKCLQYLMNKLNIFPEIQWYWCATYAHCVCNALNNKRNNV